MPAIKAVLSGVTNWAISSQIQIQIRSKDAMVQVEVKSLTLGENLG